MLMEKTAIEIEKNNVPEGGILELEQDGVEVAVCKVGQAFYAFHNNCTHEDWKLSDSYMVDGHIVCSLHGAMFDPQTGICKRGPACDPLRTYKVTAEGEKLFIDLENS
ncbi:MAG: Rieske 2Fe-2S domain-containing protein [Anaerolineales bacterium]|nr:Rieske 2Fe-2S domain-containing protein [Anaerolineales bacterium]